MFKIGDKVVTAEGAGKVEKVEPAYVTVKLEAGHFMRAQIDAVKLAGNGTSAETVEDKKRK
jgi:preprotein translocase subunit YajC